MNITHLKQLDIYGMKNVPFIQEHIKAIFEPEDSNKQNRILFYILKDDIITAGSTFERDMVSFLEHYNIFFPYRTLNVADFDEVSHTGKEKLVYRENRFLERELLKFSEDLEFVRETQNTDNDPDFVFGDVIYHYPVEKIIEYLNSIAGQKCQSELRPANIYYGYTVNEEVVEKGLLNSNLGFPYGTTAYFKTAIEKLKEKKEKKVTIIINNIENIICIY